MKVLLIIPLLIGLTSTGRITKRDVDNKKIVVCYYTNWSVYRKDDVKFFPKDINPYICTHIAYAFAKLDLENRTTASFEPWRDIVNHGYYQVVQLRQLNPELQVVLSIGGWNAGSADFTKLARDDGARKDFASNTIRFLREHQFDGLDIDWQYPAFRGGEPKDKENYVLLSRDIREAFVKEAEETGNKRLSLSIVISALAEYIEKGLDLRGLSKYVDFFTLVAYDFHLGSDPVVNHHSALYANPEDADDPLNSQLNVDATIKNLEKQGADLSKISLGIPTYGRMFVPEDPDQTAPGSPSKGSGVANTTGENGYIPYYELCKSIKAGGWTVNQSLPRMGPYAYTQDLWVGYDDPESTRRKGEYARNRGLGGISFWTIDDDDFKGECHGIGNPLVRAGRMGLLGQKDQPPKPAIKQPPPPLKTDLDSIIIRNPVTPPTTTTKAPSEPTRPVPSYDTTTATPPAPLVEPPTEWPAPATKVDAVPSHRPLPPDLGVPILPQEPDEIPRPAPPSSLVSVLQESNANGSQPSKSFYLNFEHNVFYQGIHL